MPRIRELQGRTGGAQGLIRERRPRLIELMIERRENPDVFEARQASSDPRCASARAWQFARAENDARGQAQVEIVLSEQFDQRIELAQAEARGVEQRLPKQRASRRPSPTVMC